jgi:glycosyltransferase involved in cell wall biosynthesis
MADLIARKVGSADRIVIIPNWGDATEVAPIERSTNLFAIAHGLTNKTVAQFSGNLGRTHDVETVLAAARRLEDRDGLRFLFVGYGGKTGLVSTAGDDLSNVLFAPRQSREMLGPMLSCSDATLIAFTDDMLGVSVPSRMYNVMAAGAPIIALADGRSELAQVVREEGCGWTLDTGDIDGLCKLLIFIDSDDGRGEAVRRGAAGRRAMMRRYTSSIVVSQFADLLRRAPVQGSGRQVS